MKFDLQNRQQLLTVIAAVAVALLLGDRLVLSPLVNSWKSRQERITQFRRDINKGQQLLGRESAIRDRWNSMRTNTLPEDVSVAEGGVLKAFDRWSRDSRISITSVKQQWKRAADDYMTLECRVDGYGSLSTITRFLYEIESDALALKVDLVELSARDPEGAQLTLGLQVSGLFLYPSEP